jgi:hypothetical protein
VTIRIKIDPTRCERFANRINAAPDLAVEGDRLEAVRRAVYDCPVNVISSTQD